MKMEEESDSELSEQDVPVEPQLKETLQQEENSEDITEPEKKTDQGITKSCSTEDSNTQQCNETSTKKPEKTKTKKLKEVNSDDPEEDTSEEDSENEAKKEDKPQAEASEYDPANVHYEGDVAIYTDPKSGYQYKWCKDTNEWLPKGGMTYGFENDTHTYTDAEGVTYFWDVEKNAWFPKIDDEFMARYQMSYGFVDNTTPDKPKEEVEKIEEKVVKKQVDKSGDLKRKATPAEPSWFDVNDQQNTKVYVSNLPSDITEEEFVDLMQKCGLVMRDMITGKMKVKLYAVPGTDILKGDALCTYIRIESVDLALSVLDGYNYKGKKIRVERARFEMKGEYNPSLKPKKKKKKDKEKLKKMQEKLFDWRPDKLRGERSKHERVVIVKNLFEPSLFDKDVSLILEYQQDLREECSKCGDVRRVVLYDRHPEGVAQITMREPEEADACVALLNGRWFGQRKLTSEIWDGKTKFKIAETDAQISKRLNEWDKFLEFDEKVKSETKNPVEVPTTKENEIKSTDE